MNELKGRCVSHFFDFQVKSVRTKYRPYNTKGYFSYKLALLLTLLRRTVEYHLARGRKRGKHFHSGIPVESPCFCSPFFEESLFEESYTIKKSFTALAKLIIKFNF